MELTFEQLPKAISQLLLELKDIKNLLAQNRPLPSEKNKLLTIKEAAQVLNLAVPTIYSLVGKKEIPFMKVAGGRRLYFLEQELTEWVKSGRQKTSSEVAEEAINGVINKKKR